MSSRKSFKGKKIKVGNRYTTDTDLTLTLAKISNDGEYLFMADSMVGDFFDQPKMFSRKESFECVSVNFLDHDIFRLCTIKDNIIDLKDKLKNL